MTDAICDLNTLLSVASQTFMALVVVVVMIGILV